MWSSQRQRGFFNKQRLREGMLLMGGGGGGWCILTSDVKK